MIDGLIGAGMDWCEVLRVKDGLFVCEIGQVEYGGWV